MQVNLLRRDIEQERQCAVLRFLHGEDPASICASLGRSTRWLYKWINRYTPGNTSWSKSQSKRPYSTPSRTPEQVEEIIKKIRLYLYFQGLFCGAQAIHRELKQLRIRPRPSLSTINRILRRHELTGLNTEHSQPNGRLYPGLPAEMPNQVHQADLVGPHRLKGPTSFYSLNVVDMNTGRCGVHPLFSSSAQSLINGLWAIWMRVGIPRNIQLDNETLFCGNPTHPREMGPFIRLCVHNGVEPWLIPTGEPWRNGVVKMLRLHYQQKFLDRVMVAAAHKIRKASLDFEHNHNRTYRYSKQHGQTPLQTLAGMSTKLIFPTQDGAPSDPLKRPASGRYHVIRYIRNDLSLTIFGERFAAPKETQYGYVVATIDVKEQKLKLFMDSKQVEEYDYRLS